MRWGKKCTTKKKWRIIIGWENFLFSYFAIYTNRRRRTSATSSRKKRAYPLRNSMSMTVLISNIFQLVWFLHIHRTCMTESISLSFFLLAINHFSRSACMFIIYVNCSHCSRESINVRRSQLRLPVLQIYLANKNQWIIHGVARMRKIIPIELWRLMLATL